MLIVLGWSLVIVWLAYEDFRKDKETTRNIAIGQARAYFKKDTAMRLWASEHGRIYVPVGDYYSPYPLLAHVPERDITTAAGIQLSLINPARISRQLNEDYG